jgi:PleD family two-component response regulator
MKYPTDILNGKILIVDDQLANVILIERILTDAGYRSVTSITPKRCVGCMPRTITT